MDGIKAEALDPVAHGSSNPEYVLIGFGSTKGAVREAAGLLSQQGHPALAVHLPQVYPLPDKLREIWQLPGQKWIVENNYSGQLQKLIAMEFALVPDGSVRKYDGRPFFPQGIVEQVLKGGAGR